MADTGKYSQVPTESERIEEGPVEKEGKDVPANDDIVCLKPKMNLLNGCNIIIGSIIGSGIFLTPRTALLYSGSVGLSIVVWVLCGIYSMIGAYCYAELGCMITKSGADYAYILITFGKFVAFMRLWIECMIVRPGCQAVVAKTFALYALRPFYPDCDVPQLLEFSMALLCILILTFINCWNVKWSTKVQDVFTYGKVFALLVIIGTGAYQLAQGHTENFTFEGRPESAISFSLAFYQCLFAYNGWNYLNFVIEELKEPHKNLPRAIIISCTVVTFIYAFTIISFHTLLSREELLASKAVAVDFLMPVSPYLAYCIPVFVAMSTFGGVNGILFTSARLFYSGSEHEQMPRLLSMIQVNHLTPAPAVLSICILSIFYLFLKDLGALIDYVSFSTWLAIGVAVFCVPVLRYTHPEMKRPIKVHLIWPIIYLLATVYIIGAPIFIVPKETAACIGIILTSVPVYLVFISWKSKPACIENTMGSLTKFFQKWLVVIPSEKRHDL